MAFVSITPVSGSIISTGEIITVRWSSSTQPDITYRPGSGPDEVISERTTGTGAALGAGYTGEYGVETGPIYTISFRRNAGWSTSPFTISVYNNLTEAETQLQFTLLAEGQYPPDMVPFNDPVEDGGGGGSGTVVIENSGATQGSAGILDFADNVSATVANGKATITASTGSIGDLSDVTITSPLANQVLLDQGGGNYANQALGSTNIVNVSTVAGTWVTDALETLEAASVGAGSPLAKYTAVGGATTPATGEVGVIYSGGTTYSDITDIYFDIIDSDGIQISPIWEALGAGDIITMRAADDRQVSAIMRVETVTRAGTNIHVDVTVLNGAGTFGDIPVFFWATTKSGGIGGGATSLDALINILTTTDNDVNVPLADPVILRDGGGNITPLKVVKLDASLTPAVIAEVPGTSQPGVGIRSTASPTVLANLSPSGLAFGPSTGESSSISGPGISIVASDTLALYANNGGGGGSITLGVGGMAAPDEIEFVQGITVGETADHPAAPVAGKGQFWVNNAGEPIFTSASDAAVNPGTDYDLTTATPLTLDEVITASPIDNVATIPSGNPVIFSDGAVAGLTPFSVVKTGASTVTPAVSAVHEDNGRGIDVTAGTQGTLSISALGVTPTADVVSTVTYGGGTVSTVSPGSTYFTGRDNDASAGDGGDAYVRAGEATHGTPGDGGDLLLDPGDGANAGNIKIGTVNAPTEIVFAQGFTMAEAAGPPLGTTPTGTGQFWVNDATSPPKPYFTGDDDIDIDLTAGTAVGDVTSTSAITANKLVIGDSGGKTVKQAPLGSLSDAGALTAIATIVTTSDITAGNDLVSTADVTVGVDLNVPSGDIIMGAGQLVDGRDISNDYSVWNGHITTTSGNPHDVEGVEVLSSTVGDGLVLTADGAGGAAWESVGTGDVTAGAAGGGTITDHTIVRGDGGVRGVQESGIAIDDSDNITGVVDITAETVTVSVGAESTEYGEYGIAPYASRITQFTIGGVTQTGTIIDVSLLGMASSDAAEVGGSTYVIGGIASAGTKGGDLNLWGGNSTTTGTADGGDVNISGGASFGGSLGKVYVEGSSFELATPLVTNSTIDGIDVNTDVTANTDHRNIVDATATGNPHSTSLNNLGPGTLAELNSVVMNAVIDDEDDPRPADEISTSGTNVTVSPTAPTGADEILITTSATAAGWGTITTAAITDDAVTLAKIDAHTGAVAGALGYGASGVPSEISAGASGTVLTSTGTTTAPTFQAAPTLRHFPTQYIESPAAADDVRWFKTPVAITVQGIDASVTGTSPDADFTIYHATTRDAAGTVVHTADTITSTSGTGFTSPSGDDTIPAGNYVWTEIDVIAGTVDTLELCMHFTED